MHRTWVLLREIALAAAMTIACAAVHAAGYEDPAAQYRRLQQSSDDGLVRPDGLVNALAQRERMMAARRKAAGIASGNWTALGPGNIGGRIRSLLTHPTDPGWLLAGSVTGGLWKSTDAGASWHVVADLMPSIVIESLARDPHNPQRLYAGTGEGPVQFQGLGMFVSDDGGDTWRQMPGTNPHDPGKSDFFYVERIDVHANDGNIVVVATSAASGGGGVWRSLDALSPSPTWQKISNAPAMVVKFDPFVPDRVLVGEQLSGAVGIVANVRTAGTAPGFTYARTPLNPGGLFGRVELAVSRAVPGLVLASLDQGGGVVYVSTDHGATWAFNCAPGHLDQGFYANAAWADPVDPRRAIVGGNSLYRLDGPANWWTTNTPLTITQISAFTAGSAHPDQHAIVESLGYDATTNRAVYFTNDGGVYRRDDITSSAGGFFNLGWTALNHGLEVTQFYFGTGRTFPDASTRIAGGTQDNGSLLAPASGTAWAAIGGGDGGWTAIDPVEPDTIYVESQFGALIRRRVGEFNPNICAGTHGITEASSAICHGTNSTNFISPFMLDPNNRDTMLFGALSLWRTTNVRLAEPPDWFVIKPSVSSFISAIAVANGNSDVIWVGHNDGDLYCTLDGTATFPAWTRVPLPAARMVTGITIDPANVNRIFVTFGGFNGSNVWELTDPVQACKAAPRAIDRHANLPLAPVYSVVRHPLNPQLLYAGTEVGIFASANGGVSWSPTNDGASNVSTRQLFWMNDASLVAATFGRGMFAATISPGSLQLSQVAASVGENAGSIALTVRRTGGNAGAVGVSYGTSDGTGRAGVNYTATQGTLAWADGDAGDKTVTVPILNDGVAGGNRTFAVTLSNATNGSALGAAAAATVTIVEATTVPGAPAIGTAAAGDASIVVTFSAPASDGGSPVTGYVATCTASGAPSRSANGAASPITVAGIAAGFTYTCVVAATNAVGTGPASAPTNGVLLKLAQSIAFTSTPPAAATVGDTYDVKATASSGLAVAFSIDAASSAVCTIAAATVSFTAPGTCTIDANQAGDATHLAAPTFSQAIGVAAPAPPPDPPRLANISTRMQVLTGDDVMIGGFIVGGASPKTVVITALGPSLAAAGIGDPLANPTLTLVRSSDQQVIATNDDWGTAANAAQIQAVGLAPANALESAIMVTLAPGAYTAIVQGAGGGTGVGIVAVYEVDHPEVPLINISTRGEVLTGNDVMIGGFIVQGSGPQTVVVTAIGPSLVGVGIPNALANPTLTLVRSSDHAIIAANDDWEAAPNASQIRAVGLAPANAAESAIMVTLQPGAYTAIVSGAGGTTGVGIVAVYAVQ